MSDYSNRLSSSRVFTNINTTTNQWQSGAGTNPSAYATDYTYDAMGNILTQKRNGGGTSATALDELTYNYHTTTDGLVSNRLYHVNDVVSAGNYTDDIDDQGTFNNTHSTIETANNYGYDELGNLVRDVQEEIASIEWTVYGKMKKITRNSGSSKADLEFGYDASGNRLWKKVTPKGSGAVISTYYYLRDAQGNEMCRYVKYTNTSSQLMYVAQEHSIYGSSRVSVDNRKDTLYLGAVYTTTWGGVGASRRELGLKSFELANHLGNVLVTVSDKPIYKVSSATIFFQPEVTSISDYYPFGAPINGRSAAFGDNYRFGFGGHELDEEVKGSGNHLSFGDYGYDTRLGKRWNIDPMTAKAPAWSAYAFCFNNPILMFDPNGAWPWPIWARSFITASDVGAGNFRGDERGPSLSTAQDVTSRTWINFTFDPQKQLLTNKRKGADETILFAPPELGMGDRYPLYGETPKPNVSYTDVSTEKNSFGNNIGTFGFSYDCKDPVTPGLFTPSLDVHSIFSITEDLKINTLFVNATFTGDVFPSTEAFISDQSGTKLFLGARKETGGVGDLFGDNNKPLFTVNMQIKFDGKGNFTGVNQGDKLINVADWNKQVESKFEKNNQ